MNALTPTRLLRVADDASTGTDQVAVLGRDIRTPSERIDSANPTLAQSKLLRLLEQHRAEWSAFMSSLPERSWVREIVGQL
jgi:hypothetical protein